MDSRLQRSQNWSAKYWDLRQRFRGYMSCGWNSPGGAVNGRVFMVNNIAGVSGCVSSMSDGMIPIGRKLTIPCDFCH